MSHLDHYVPHFDALAPEQAQYLANALEIETEITGDDVSLDGHILFLICSRVELDHATVVMALADDPSVTAICVMETLIGHPITRSLPTNTAPQERNRTRASPGRRNDPRVIVFVAPNPKRPGQGPAMRYDQYRVGQTVSEAIAAGLTPADIAWDLSHGYIRVEDPT